MNPILHFAGVADTRFGDRMLQSAAALHAAGIRAGDAVAVLLRNEPAFLEMVLAAREIGARWLPINWHFRPAELRHILEDSGAPILIGHTDLLAAARDGIPATTRVFGIEPHAATKQAFGIDGDALAPAAFESWAALRDRVGSGAGARPPQPPGSAMLYTSGTTGRPKGIVRDAPTPEQVAAAFEAYRIALGVEPGMRALMSAPLYHAAPAAYATLAALKDADLWIEPRFDAEATLALIERHALTHLYLVPTMYVRLLKLPDAVRARYDLSSLRFVASTGSACAPEVKRKMIDWWGPLLHETYAASELGLVTHADSADAIAKPGTAGRALPGVTIRIFDEARRECAPGEVGLIHARATWVTDFRYTHGGDARAKLEHEGLWTLGDMGCLDRDGHLFVVDRLSDMVVSGGVNIYPAEIEKALIGMPGVADCAVFGIPDDEFGEALCAAVQPQPGAAPTEAAVQHWLRERLAGFKVPRRIDFHAELPREETGKIFKRRLREPFWAGRQRRV